MIRKILCKALTLGQHWWTYGVHPQKKDVLCVYCRICGFIPGDQWKIYKKKFLEKSKGVYKVPTNTNQIFRGRKNVATRKK